MSIPDCWTKVPKGPAPAMTRVDVAKYVEYKEMKEKPNGHKDLVLWQAAPVTAKLQKLLTRKIKGTGPTADAEEKQWKSANDIFSALKVAFPDFEFYVMGGSVRDACLSDERDGVKVKEIDLNDLDVTFNVEPVKIAEWCKQQKPALPYTLAAYGLYIKIGLEPDEAKNETETYIEGFCEQYSASQPIFHVDFTMNALLFDADTNLVIDRSGLGVLDIERRIARPTASASCDSARQPGAGAPAAPAAAAAAADVKAAAAAAAADDEFATIESESYPWRYWVADPCRLVRVWKFVARGWELATDPLSAKELKQMMKMTYYTWRGDSGPLRAACYKYLHKVKGEGLKHLEKALVSAIAKNTPSGNAQREWDTFWAKAMSVKEKSKIAEELAQLEARLTMQFAAARKKQPSLQWGKKKFGRVRAGVGVFLDGDVKGPGDAVLNKGMEEGADMDIGGVDLKEGDFGIFVAGGDQMVHVGAWEDVQKGLPDSGKRLTYAEVVDKFKDHDHPVLRLIEKKLSQNRTDVLTLFIENNVFSIPAARNKFAAGKLPQLKFGGPNNAKGFSEDVYTELVEALLPPAAAAAAN